MVYGICAFTFLTALSSSMSALLPVTNGVVVNRAAVVYDMNGREASDTEPILAAVGDIGQYIFCSSAGVYLKSDQMPHMEDDATDPNSRHKVSGVFLQTFSCDTITLFMEQSAWSKPCSIKKSALSASTRRWTPAG